MFLLIISFIKFCHFLQQLLWRETSDYTTADHSLFSEARWPEVDDISNINSSRVLCRLDKIHVLFPGMNFCANVGECGNTKKLPAMVFCVKPSMCPWFVS
jgi:hypothetical protein